MNNLEAYTNRKVIYHSKQDGGTVTQDVTCTLLKVVEQGVILGAPEGNQRFQERFIPWDAVGYIDLIQNTDRAARAV